jgi:hypothetical protein
VAIEPAEEAADLVEVARNPIRGCSHWCAGILPWGSQS